jgi:hypothetical protein
LKSKINKIVIEYDDPTKPLTIPVTDCCKMNTHVNNNGNNKWRVGDEVLYEGQRYYVRERLPQESIWKIGEIGEDVFRIVHEDNIQSKLPIERSLFIDYLLPEKTSKEVIEANEKANKEWKVGDLVDAMYSNGIWLLAEIIGIIEPNKNLYRVRYLNYNDSYEENKVHKNIAAAGTVTKWLNRVELEDRRKNIGNYY